MVDHHKVVFLFYTNVSFFHKGWMKFPSLCLAFPAWAGCEGGEAELCSSAPGDYPAVLQPGLHPEAGATWRTCFHEEVRGIRTFTVCVLSSRPSFTQNHGRPKQNWKSSGVWPPRGPDCSSPHLPEASGLDLGAQVHACFNGSHHPLLLLEGRMLGEGYRQGNTQQCSQRRPGLGSQLPTHPQLHGWA